MTNAQLCMLILLVIVVAGSVRLFWQRQTDNSKFRVWLIVFLQAGSAVLLYLSLFPPDRTVPAQRIQIVTANAVQKVIQQQDNLRAYALPEAQNSMSAERAPDLATVLRRNPHIKELEILGDGLPVRDLDAARQMAINYQAIPIEQGIIELGLPVSVVPGQQWRVHGRVAQALATVELVDPSNTVVGRVTTDKSGKFSLTDTARGIGNALYQVRVSDAKTKTLETVIIPITTIAAQKLNVLSMSGGVNPELKYLKRWALDADVNLQSSVSLGLGKQIQSAPLALNQASLKELDLLILDERAWMTLSADNQVLIRSAAQGGMGVLLRITGPLSSQARTQWRSFGFEIQDTNSVQALRLSEPNQQKKLPELSRQAVKVSSSDAVPLLADSRGEALGLWRAYGLGRVGVWLLNDSYRLVLADNDDRHGAIWSAISTTLARAKQKSSIQIPNQSMWVNERAVFCGLTEKAAISPPEGESNSLLLETQGANKNCAAFWPKYAGWHALNSAGQSRLFYVREADEATALHRRTVQQATMALAGSYKPTVTVNTVAVPGSHWPYFVFWLVLTALLWVLERSKWGFKRRVA